MKKTTLILFFCLGALALIAGLFLVFNDIKPYGVGFTSLGVMWIVICFGLAKKVNKNSAM